MDSIASQPPLMVDIDLVGWGDPPAKKSGDPDDASLYAAVGRALSAWEILESNFALAFTQFSSGSRGESLPFASGRIFGSVPAGATRQKMLGEISEIYSVYENKNFDVKAFKRLLSHYGHAVRSRNNIAHGIVFEVKSPDTLAKPAEFFLGPAMYLTSRNVRVDKWREGVPEDVVNPGWSFSYTAADVAEFADRYRSLSSRVMKVTSVLIDWQVAENMKKAERYAAMRAASI